MLKNAETALVLTASAFLLYSVHNIYFFVYGVYALRIAQNHFDHRLKALLVAPIIIKVYIAFAVFSDYSYQLALFKITLVTGNTDAEGAEQNRPRNLRPFVEVGYVVYSDFVTEFALIFRFDFVNPVVEAVRIAPPDYGFVVKHFYGNFVVLAERIVLFHR